MITLINTNTMKPPIAPVGLDYIAGAVRKVGIDVEVLDLCLSNEPNKTIKEYFSIIQPELVAMTFRNIDDCFWPRSQWFVPELKQQIEQIRQFSDAKIVVGGVGFSIMPEPIMKYCGADFGIRGDGEDAIVALYNELTGGQRYENVPGLIWKNNGSFVSNKPAWPEELTLPTQRNEIDNITYFKLGGQCGVETKRGCNRPCIYCVDSLAKGKTLRLRRPDEITEEFENLLKKGIDVFHICDSEFNIPINHAKAVCTKLIQRGLGGKIRWYTYMTVTPFDNELAELMRKAGCAGIDFTGDSANAMMLSKYHQPHQKEDFQNAVELCRSREIAVMFDLLLGGPCETVDTLSETIDFMKTLNPDCVGAALGVRLYPDTVMADIVRKEGKPETNPNIKRKYSGQVDFLKPTFYISYLLGTKPAELVRDLIDGDKRFFEPMSEMDDTRSKDHNYNDNTELCQAIEAGARGAYWDILRKIRS
ncbi:MAG: cobalamin-dependent protein [Sedimentisphaerales bacterium]|nr:cobalamin-dependent protein [Sedimentisphaerales bacterium]